MQVLLTYNYRPELYTHLNLESLVLFVLERMDCPDNTDVSLTFVTDEEIHELNKRYRGIDKPTDVLSFECDTIPFEGETPDCQEEYELGDIIIATDVALRQTQEFDTTFKEEITLLVVHGLLHLMGYDHMNDEEAEIMESLETELINAWNDMGSAYED